MFKVSNKDTTMTIFFCKSHKKTPVLEALYNKTVGQFKVIDVFLVSLLLTHICFCIFIEVFTMNM